MPTLTDQQREAVDAAVVSVGCVSVDSVPLPSRADVIHLLEERGPQRDIRRDAARKLRWIWGMR